MDRVSAAGLDAVLVAVDLVVESGVLCAEHVENVLARFNAVSVPPSVEMSLQLSVPLKADTGRYDRLCDEATLTQDEEAHHADSSQNFHSDQLGRSSKPPGSILNRHHPENWVIFRPAGKVTPPYS